MQDIHIIILSGLGRSDHSYKKIIQSAPEHIRVTVIPFNEFSTKLDENLQLIEKKLHALRIEKAHFVCHSLGGIIGVQLAVQKPNRVETLTLIDSSGIHTNRFNLFEKAVFETTLQHSFQKIIDNALLVFRAARHPIRFWNLFTYSADTDIQSIAEDISVPSSIIWGEKDRLTTPEEGKKLHELIHNSDYIEIPNADHDWLLYMPDIFWKAYHPSNGFVKS